MFAGWEGEAGLNDVSVQTAIATLAVAIAPMLDGRPDVGVVMSGSGTSGRVAFFVARAFNLLLTARSRPPVFHYLTAGDDAALFMSREAPEDNWRIGRERLADCVANHTHMVFIGITCGMSAPFVAAQLEYAMDHIATITPVLLSFNPTALARAVPIEGWDKTFADVVARMLRTPKALIINPVVGPEAVTGSTRMKGGSATKIILDTAAALALANALDGTIPPSAAAVAAVLSEYEHAATATYSAAKAISAVVEQAGATFTAGGHVYYLGEGSYGILGLVDASECPPTFNAHWDDVRGFLDHGFDTLQNKEGDLTRIDASLQLSWAFFERELLLSLTPHDLVVFLLAPDTQVLPPLASLVIARGAKTACVTFAPNMQFATGLDDMLMVPLVLPSRHLSILGQGDSLSELAVKLVLNAITTGGHVLKGKVMGNVMIDLQVSNNKLFYRAIHIVGLFSGAAPAVAQCALLSAIYCTSEAGPHQMETVPISNHIRAAAAASAAGVRVVSTAVLLAACPHLDFAAAVRVLQEEPIVRKALLRTMVPATT